MTRVYSVIRAEGQVIENGKSVATVRGDTLVIQADADPVAEALRQIPDLRRCSRIRVERIGRKMVQMIREYRQQTAEELREAGEAQAADDKWHDTGRGRRREFSFGTSGNLERWGKVQTFGPGREEDAE